MVKYLENDICEFKCLFDFNPKVKKNIVSVSFFKMYNNLGIIGGKGSKKP